ncbi:acyl carrier protein [Streptomyces phaeofaciens]|uniref:acyl carrier protein n=1 Tax=Streptomyces phaeofaciens TaxID=68254 RepID=UPI0036C77312
MTDEDELLAAVCEAWADTLGIDADAVPVDEGFFDAGGNSLLLVLLCEQLGERTGRTVSAADVFQHPSVLAQVRLLAEDR